MRFHCATATGADLEAACRAVAEAIRSGLGDGPIDLVVVFASPRYGASIDRLPVLLHDLLAPRSLVGCTGGTLVGNGITTGSRHAVTVLAGRLPGVELSTALVTNGDLPDPDAAPSAWHDLMPPTTTPMRGMIVLCEPFQFDAPALLAGLDFGWPNVPKLGGITSGSRHPEGHVLFVGRQAHHSGALVAGLAGDVSVEPVVSQGCRPVGRPGRITKADANRLVAVDDAPAQRFLEEQLAGLGGDELALAAGSPLFLGIASDPFAVDAPAQGDFLVRNILGVDPTSGNMLVADRLGIGRHVQLHLRDRRCSERDLEDRLRRARPATTQAALLFRCLGREGSEHEQFAAAANGVPLAGFHSSGEIGPVGDTTHLLRYTAAFALLRRRPPHDPAP